MKSTSSQLPNSLLCTRFGSSRSCSRSSSPLVRPSVHNLRQSVSIQHHCRDRWQNHFRLKENHLGRRESRRSLWPGSGSSICQGFFNQVGKDLLLPTQIIPQNSHQSQGTVERFRKTLYGQVRAIKLGLGAHLGIHPDSTAGRLMPWIVQYVVFSINQYLIRQDGKTSYERVFNKAHSGSCSSPAPPPKSFIWELSLIRSTTHCGWGNASPLEWTLRLTKVRFSKPEQSPAWSKNSTSILWSSARSFFLLMNVNLTISRASRRSHCTSGTAQVTHHVTKVKDVEQRFQAPGSEVQGHCWARRLITHGFISRGSKSASIIIANVINIDLSTSTSSHSSSPRTSNASRTSSVAASSCSATITSHSFAEKPWQLIFYKKI